VAAAAEEQRAVSRLHPVPTRITEGAERVLRHFDVAKEREHFKEQMRLQKEARQKDREERRRRREVERKALASARVTQRLAEKAAAEGREPTQLEREQIEEEESGKQVEDHGDSEDSDGDDREDSEDNIVDDLLTQHFMDEPKLAEALCSVDVKLLDLSEHRWVSTRFLKGLGHAFPQIRGLNLRNCQVTDEVVAEIVEHCKVLTELDISGATMVTNISGLSSLSELRVLRLGRCAQAATTALVSSFCSLTKLEHLDLSMCPQWGDPALIALSERIRTLKVINFKGCAGITSAGLKAVCAMNPNMREVHMAMNDQPTMTDDGVAGAMACMKRLEMLDICGCKNVGRLTAAAVCRNCHYITRLNLASLPRLDGADILRILRDLKKLEFLDICGNADVSPQALHEGVQVSRSLAHLNLSLIPAVTEDFIQALKKSQPALQVVWHSVKHVHELDLEYVLRLPDQREKKKKKGAKKKGGKGKKK